MSSLNVFRKGGMLTTILDVLGYLPRDSLLDDVDDKAITDADQKQHIDDDKEWDFLLDQLYTNKSHDFVEKTRVRLQRARDKVRRAREEVKRKRFQLENVPQYVKLKDKFAFTLGIVSLCVNVYLVGARPDIFPLYYAFHTVLLIGMRAHLYRLEGWGYFLLDFCYVANFLLTLVCVALPWRNNPVLFQVLFAFANGPLGFAVCAWRNSLVFHSLDKMTSLFIHLCPCLLTYALRHGIDDGVYSKHVYENQTWGETIYNQLWLSTLMYCAWQAAYYLKVQVLDREKIMASHENQNGKKLYTSYIWLKTSSGLLMRLVNYLPRMYHHVAFGVIQLLYTWVTMIPTVFLFFSPLAHAAWLWALFALSCWNGANFYVEVFSRRYQSHLDDLTQKNAANVLPPADATKKET